MCSHRGSMGIGASSSRSIAVGSSWGVAVCLCASCVLLRVGKHQALCEWLLGQRLQPNQVRVHLCFRQQRTQIDPAGWRKKLPQIHIRRGLREQGFLEKSWCLQLSNVCYTRVGPRSRLKNVEVFFLTCWSRSSYPCPGVMWFCEASAKEAVNTLVSESC